MSESLPERPSVFGSYGYAWRLCLRHVSLWLIPLFGYLLSFLPGLASIFSVSAYQIFSPDLLNLASKIDLAGGSVFDRLASAWQAVATWETLALSIRSLFAPDLLTSGGFLALAILAIIFCRGLESLFTAHRGFWIFCKSLLVILAICFVFLGFSFFVAWPEVFRVALTVGMLAWSFLLAAFFSLAVLVYLGYLRDKVRQEPSDRTALFLRAGMSLAPLFGLLIVMSLVSGRAVKIISTAGAAVSLIFGRAAAPVAAVEFPWQVLAFSAAVLVALSLFGPILLVLRPVNRITEVIRRTFAVTLKRLDGWVLFLATGAFVQFLFIFMRQICLGLPVYWIWYDTIIQIIFGSLQILFLVWFTVALFIWLDEAHRPLPQRIVVRLTSGTPVFGGSEDKLNPVELKEEVPVDQAYFEDLEKELDGAPIYSSAPDPELQEVPLPEVPVGQDLPEMVEVEPPSSLSVSESKIEFPELPELAPERTEVVSVASVAKLEERSSRQDLQEDILFIQKRNSRVELDKAWETSATRRIFISIMTYIVALVWLLLIRESQAYFKAIVPVAGYILSTLSLAPLRFLWTKWRLGRTCSDCGRKLAE